MNTSYLASYLADNWYWFIPMMVGIVLIVHYGLKVTGEMDARAKR